MAAAQAEGHIAKTVPEIVFQVCPQRRPRPRWQQR